MLTPELARVEGAHRGAAVFRQDDSAALEGRSMKLTTTAFADGGAIPAEFAFGAIDPAHARAAVRQSQSRFRVDGRSRGHAIARAHLPRSRRAVARRRREPGRARRAGVAAARRFLPLGAGRPAAGRAADRARRVLRRRHARAASRARMRRAARARASTTTPAGSPATRTWPATISATTGRVRRGTTRSSHRYVFTLFALDVARLGVAGVFGGADAREAMAGHVLAQAAVTGRYTLNPAVRL